MEQCFKIVLGMFFIIGSLQASPICTKSTKELSFDFNTSDMVFKLTKKEVSCGPNVTFITPINVQPICYTKALDVFSKGLKQAMANCTDENDRLGTVLGGIKVEYQESTNLTIPEHCPCFEESPKQSVQFLNTLEAFLWELNSKKSTTETQ